MLTLANVFFFQGCCAAFENITLQSEKYKKKIKKWLNRHPHLHLRLPPSAESTRLTCQTSSTSPLIYFCWPARPCVVQLPASSNPPLDVITVLGAIGTSWKGWRNIGKPPLWLPQQILPGMGDEIITQAGRYGRCS